MALMPTEMINEAGFAMYYNWAAEIAEGVTFLHSKRVRALATT